MRRASLSPLAACEKTTNAGDGKCADPYSEPSMAIGFDIKVLNEVNRINCFDVQTKNKRFCKSTSAINRFCLSFVF